MSNRIRINENYPQEEADKSDWAAFHGSEGVLVKHSTVTQYDVVHLDNAPGADFMVLHSEYDIIPDTTPSVEE